MGDGHDGNDSLASVAGERMCWNVIMAMVSQNGGVVGHKAVREREGDR